MNQEPRINPDHQQQRESIRLIGKIVLSVGILLSVIGFGSFFSSFGSFEPPRYFWCALLGLPMVGIGSALLKAGYLGAISRYFAQEAAPVGKDTFNYMATETRPGVRATASAIAEGLTQGVRQSPPAIVCAKCLKENDGDARFCKACGEPLSSKKVCPACARENDADATFCDGCGKRIDSKETAVP